MRAVCNSKFKNHRKVLPVDPFIHRMCMLQELFPQLIQQQVGYKTGMGLFPIKENTSEARGRFLISLWSTQLSLAFLLETRPCNGASEILFAESNFGSTPRSQAYGPREALGNKVLLFSQKKPAKLGKSRSPKKTNKNIFVNCQTSSKNIYLEYREYLFAIYIFAFHGPHIPKPAGQDSGRWHVSKSNNSSSTVSVCWKTMAGPWTSPQLLARLVL